MSGDIWRMVLNEVNFFVHATASSGSRRVTDNLTQVYWRCSAYYFSH